LTEDFKNANDPISPSGIKNEGLLESAISRQSSGYGNYIKYNTPVSNAATLCYGLCCNHPLHNGNKRTALVAMLCHLDRNNLTFNERANQDDMYRFILRVAKHWFSRRNKKRSDNSDFEIE
jgi:death-on-curing protein